MGSKKEKRVQYHLDTKGITELPFSEIKAILRGADELIARGGRNLLAKILKGSKEKKLLELGLDKSPVYGFYKDLKIEDITARIDWLIKKGYLEIEYDYRLPVIVYSEKGWEIERDTYSDELLEKLEALLPGGDFTFVNELKDRNRGMILLLLQKIEATRDWRFIPLLMAWREIDYQKVRQEISRVIESLEAVASTKKEPVEKAFKGIFPANALDVAAIDAMFGSSDRPVDIGGNVYIFKASYKRGVWRRIRISSAHTLHHLHEAIQEAYCFDGGHLYAFFMDGKPWSEEAYWSPHSDGPPYADKTTIGGLGLKRGQRFLYLFDFGDEWKFTVQAEKILQSDLPPARPVIIESCGEAPEQYPDMFWGNEDDDE